jgi:multiple sugar transport system permease protein
VTSATRAHSVVEPSGRSKSIAGTLIVVYAVLSMVPLVWIFLTAFKSPPDSIAYPPKVIFKATMDGYCSLFTTISRQTPEYIASLPPPTSICDKVARARNMVVAGPSNFLPRFVNSLVIAFGSTALSVLWARWRPTPSRGSGFQQGRPALLHPVDTHDAAVAVAIPVYLCPVAGPSDTRLGMILLYTAVNVSLSVWLLKGFIDEIPRAYEEAALVDGYTRLQAFRKIVLPQATTGIVATAIFCLIFAWNEYAFAVLLTSGQAQTTPPFIPFIIGEGGQDWPAVAAATTLFLVPILGFTVLLRKNLLRGITFGAVRK